MKISKLLAVVILLLTSFVDLYGVLIEIEPDKVIKTVELRTSDERFLVKFEFMDVKDFEKIKETVKLKGKLQKLYNDFERNAPANPKVCFVQFENFGNKKIELEDSLGRFFREYGIGPFHTLPELTTVSHCRNTPICALGGAVGLLGLLFVLIILPRFYPFNVWLACEWMLVGGLLICLMFPNNIRRNVRRFSERTDVVLEEGIFFIIGNEFLEECWGKLKKMSLQVEGAGVLCKFTSPTGSLSTEDYELRTIEVVDNEEREDSSE